MEQDIGFEPMTFSLATKHSTSEVILHCVRPGFTPGVPHVVITAALHYVIAIGCQRFQKIQAQTLHITMSGQCSEAWTMFLLYIIF